MNSEVKIQSSDSVAKLTLSHPEIDVDPRLNYFTATIEDAGLRASARVYADMAESIPPLFEDIAANWRG
jgi:hypothetical protein